MKHLLNDLSEEEKNRIREQHSGGKKIVIENFNKLINTKLGDAKPYLNEEKEAPKTCSGDVYVLPGKKEVVGISGVGDWFEIEKRSPFVAMQMCVDGVLVPCQCEYNYNTKKAKCTKNEPTF
jgi:hypothetical protein